MAPPNEQLYRGCKINFNSQLQANKLYFPAAVEFGIPHCSVLHCCTVSLTCTEPFITVECSEALTVRFTVSHLDLLGSKIPH